MSTSEWARRVVVIAGAAAVVACGGGGGGGGGADAGPPVDLVALRAHCEAVNDRGRTLCGPSASLFPFCDMIGSSPALTACAGSLEDTLRCWDERDDASFCSAGDFTPPGACRARADAFFACLAPYLDGGV